MKNESEFRKVFFQLKTDEDDYPPVNTESLNAKRLNADRFQIDNTPFFVEGIALGDIITVDEIPESNEKYWFKKVLKQSENNSLSIIFLDNSCIDKVKSELNNFGCYCEYGKIGSLEMLAVSVKKGKDYNLAFDYLESLEKLEIISFSELALAK